MRKQSGLLLGIVLICASCSIGTYAPRNVNNFGTQTMVVLDKANFRIVRHVEAVIDVRNDRLRREDVEKSAYAELLRQANLTGSQALINVSIEEIRRRALIMPPKLTQWVAARGTIIEFLDDNGNPVQSMPFEGTAPRGKSASETSTSDVRAENAQPIINKEVNETAYVDLGLPSGTLWKDKNEEGGFYTYDQAVSRFGSKLPTKEQLTELNNSCTWTWQGNGYNVVGPNGNSIFLPAAGCRSCDGSAYGVGSDCYYWSSTPRGANAWYLLCDSEALNLDFCEHCYGLSVRLVQ